MTQKLLTKTRFANGVWEGVLTGPQLDQADIEVTYLNDPVPGVSLADEADGARLLRVQVPAEIIGDGVQTFVIRDKASQMSLGSFTLICGDAVADDIRAELDLLRQELDLLKTAFRRANS